MKKYFAKKYFSDKIPKFSSGVREWIFPPHYLLDFYSTPTPPH